MDRRYNYCAEKVQIQPCHAVKVKSIRCKMFRFKLMTFLAMREEAGKPLCSVRSKVLQELCVNSIRPWCFTIFEVFTIYWRSPYFVNIFVRGGGGGGASQKSWNHILPFSQFSQFVDMWEERDRRYLLGSLAGFLGFKMAITLVHFQLLTFLSN